MIDFEVNNGNLIAFLEKCACNGVVLITATEKVKRNFFNNFYLDIESTNEGTSAKISVKAVDSEEKRMYIRHVLDNIDAEVTGRFAVNDVDSLIGMLKKIPTTRKINFTHDDNNTIHIKTIDNGTYYGFKMRQDVLSDEVNISLSESTHGVAEWDSYHSFEDGIPKITVGDNYRLYNTIIKINKMELKKIVGISTDLTKDQDLKISIKDNKISFKSGKKRETIQSEMNLNKDIENPIEVSEKVITNLHPIVDHIFDETKLFLRLAGDGALKFWIQSVKDDIELNFCSGSL